MIKGQRRSIRLKNFDYAKEGRYFVTIDVQDKKKLFWKMDWADNWADMGKLATDGRGKSPYLPANGRLSLAGLMIAKTIWEMGAKYSGVAVDEFVVMPDHIHLIIHLGNWLKNGQIDDPMGGSDQSNINGRMDDQSKINGRIRGSARTLGPDHIQLSLSEVIQRFKMLTTKRYIDGIKNFGWERFNHRLWQRNFYERIVRSQKEYEAVKQYIRKNPGKLQIFGLKDAIEFQKIDSEPNEPAEINRIAID